MAADRVRARALLVPHHAMFSISRKVCAPRRLPVFTHGSHPTGFSYSPPRLLLHGSLVLAPHFLFSHPAGFSRCTSMPSPSRTTGAGPTLPVFTPHRLQSLHLHAFAFTDHGFSAFTSRLQSLTRLVITSSGSYPGVRGSVGVSVGHLSFHPSYTKPAADGTLSGAFVCVAYMYTCFLCDFWGA